MFGCFCDGERITVILEELQFLIRGQVLSTRAENPADQLAKLGKVSVSGTRLIDHLAVSGL